MDRERQVDREREGGGGERGREGEKDGSINKIYTSLSLNIVSDMAWPSNRIAWAPSYYNAVLKEPLILP